MITLYTEYNLHGPGPSIVPLFILTRMDHYVLLKKSSSVNYYEIKACMTVISILFGHYTF